MNIWYAVITESGACEGGTASDWRSAVEKVKTFMFEHALLTGVQAILFRRVPLDADARAQLIEEAGAYASSDEIDAEQEHDRETSDVR